MGYVVGVNINVPTAPYNRNNPSSLGKNYWMIQPVWAISYFPADDK
ncbi:transporter [Xenorhabdus cabanillasii]|nr:transporter [Xenorhabdus cabanillasii]